VAISGPLRGVHPALRQQLLDDLTYLNMREVRVLCERLEIPYRILIETEDGRTKPTKDTDRKPIVLDRVRHYLMRGEVPGPTRIPARIVREGDPPARLKPTNRLYYRWYDKTNPSIMGILAELTGGRFRNGALARVLVMEFWSAGRAPTFEEFARAWVAAKAEPRDLLSPEYAYLTDVQCGRAGAGWKAKRKEKAERAIAALDRIVRA
jgi:hypothetical protein